MRVEVVLHDHGLRSGFGHLRKSPFELVGAIDEDWHGPKVGGRRPTQLLHIGTAIRVGGRCRSENGDALEPRIELTEDLQAFPRNLGICSREARSVSAWSHHAGDKAAFDGRPDTITIGIVRVAARAALVVWVKWVTMTSAGSRTSSAASSAARSARPLV